MNIENETELIEYLTTNGHIADGEKPILETLSGRVSNRAVIVKRASDEAWVLKQALPKLRVKTDWFSDPKRIHREALGIRWLSQLTAPGTIPNLLFEDREQHILAMSAVPQPHMNWKQMLLASDVQQHHVKQFAQIIAHIHHKSRQRQDEIEPIFRDRHFFETLRLEPYYSYTASQQPAAAAFYETLIADTHQNRTALVHGDYSPKNILVYHDRLILLDHEVIHWGDPAFDIGFSMTHLLSKAHHIVDRRTVLLEAAHEYWRGYTSEVSCDDEFERRAVRHTLACMLARVDGRSPLEYLTKEERQRQRHIILNFITHPPVTITDLIQTFSEVLQV